MTIDHIKALVGLEALAKAATPGPWEWVNPDDDAKRKEGEWSSSLRTVEHFGENKTEVIDGKSYTSFSLPKFILSAELDCGNNMDADAAFIAAANPSVILAAIEALKPMADMVMVPREPTEEICNKLRAVLPELFDTSDDTLREIYIDMLAAASPSASTGKDGVVERVARAICRENCAFVGEKPCFEVEGAWPNPNCQEPGCHAQATAALAAINGEKR